MHDLNKWRGINLLCIVSKVMSIRLNMRVQQLLEVNGHPMQFGAIPKVGYAEAVFSIKSILQLRREYGVDTHAVFIDLIKACDSVKHEVISSTLKIIGAPERHIRWVEKLYGNFEVILKIGKE